MRERRCSSVHIAKRNYTTTFFVNKMHFYFSFDVRTQHSTAQPTDPTDPTCNAIYVKCQFNIYKKKLKRGNGRWRGRTTSALPATREHWNRGDTNYQGCAVGAILNSKLDCLSAWHMISTVSDRRLHAIVCEWRISSRHSFLRFVSFLLVVCCCWHLASSGRDECGAHIFPFMVALSRGKTRSCSHSPSKLELNKSSSSSSIVCHRNLQTIYRSNCLLCCVLMVVGWHMHREQRKSHQQLCAVDFSELCAPQMSFRLY